MAITERDFSTQIEDLLKMFGWKYAHFRPARTEHGWRTAMSGSKGFLDYIALRPPRILVFEVKSETGKMTSEQQEWFDLWEQCQKPLLLEPLELKEGKASVTLKAGQKILTIPEVYLWHPSDFERITEILR